MMNDTDKEHLINEIAQDLFENPNDSFDIFRGLKEGYPDDALEIGLAAIQIVRDRKLYESDAVQQGLKEMREGKTVEL